VNFAKLGSKPVNFLSGKKKWKGGGARDIKVERRDIKIEGRDKETDRQIDKKTKTKKHRKSKRQS
jgi:hypothetical protein